MFLILSSRISKGHLTAMWPQLAHERARVIHWLKIIRPITGRDKAGTCHNRFNYQLIPVSYSLILYKSCYFGGLFLFKIPMAVVF